MTRILALIVVVAQFTVLIFMAGQREWVARTGRTIFLRTAPVDPNDPVRGEYVRLNYEISQVPRACCNDGVTSWLGHGTYDASIRDRRVYAKVKLDSDGLAELVSLCDAPPGAGTYLRGRIDWPNWNPDSLRVRYGIEALFVEEGKAQSLKATRRAEMAGVPLDMEVAVNADGLAVLKGYHWEPLGLLLTVERPPAPPRSANASQRQGQPQPALRPPGLTGATLELKNHSDRPVAVLTNSFRLIANPQRSPGHYRWVGAESAPRKPTAEDVKVLQPGELYRAHVDFSSAEWLVIDPHSQKGGAPAVALGSLTNAWDASFRFEYAPPSAEDCSGLPDANLIWHRALPSRAFGPAGRVD